MQQKGTQAHTEYEGQAFISNNCLTLGQLPILSEPISHLIIGSGKTSTDTAFDVNFGFSIICL